MEYYEALGVSKDADDSAIKKAYRKAAMKYHPDKNPGDLEAEEKFKIVNEAYSVLSDSQKRQTYDLYGKDGMNQHFQRNSNQNPFDVFNDIFGDFFGQHQSRRVKKSSNIHVDLEVQLKEIVFGDSRELRIPIKEKCKPCNGTGSDGPLITCDQCHGTGQIRFMRGFMNMAAVCDKCQGTGKIIRFFCKSCKGTGKQHENRDIVIKIPVGIRPEQTIRLEGVGNRDEDIPGDLLVTLRLRSTPFKISGDDLVSEIKIDCFEAMMGCEKQISTLDGEKKISIPAGIQPFKKIRLASLGYPRSLNSRARGNFLVEVKVFIPKIEDIDTVNLLNKVRGL